MVNGTWVIQIMGATLYLSAHNLDNLGSIPCESTQNQSVMNLSWHVIDTLVEAWKCRYKKRGSMEALKPVEID